MLTFRTKLLLIVVPACGVGMGALAPFSDGLYSAILLFAFPFLAAFLALSIGFDLSRTPAAKAAKEEWRVREKRPAARHIPQMPMITSQRVN
jgi:hypothetical protein